MTHQHAVDAQAVERYVLDEMPELERYRFEAHYFECPECAEDLRLFHMLRTDATVLFDAAPSRASEPDSAPRAAWWPSWRTAAPWAAAAVLAVALVLQVRTPGPLETAEMARAYDPVALRPASRGALPSVTLPDTRGHVALALDVNIGAPGDAITYTLARDPGDGVLSGRATVPAPGVPLVVLVPTGGLEAGATYVLTLEPGNSQTPPAEYRFAVAAR